MTGATRATEEQVQPRSGQSPDSAAMNTMTDDKSKHWYIIHTYSGFENKVRESLEQRVQAYGLGDEIGEILIPTEDIVEKRGGREVKSSRRFFPGTSSWKCTCRTTPGMWSRTHRR